MTPRRLWFALIFVVAGSFAILGYFGREIYRQAPPIPRQVVTESGRILFVGADIRDGQNVWQSMGGHQVGSIWGHGAYVAPDWSADWLHRESLWLQRHWARRDFGADYEQLAPEQRAQLDQRLQREMRTNTHHPATGTLTISDDRAGAIAAVGEYFAAILGDATAFSDEVAPLADGGMSPPELRKAYALPARTIRDPERQRQLNAFFFWASWACVAERPVAGDSAALAAGVNHISYTNNWPHDPLLGNRPSGALILWSLVSIVAMLAGVGALAWFLASRQSDEELTTPPADDPLLKIRLTPSMRATLKYFWVVAALFLVQVMLGVITAHYGVEGGGFYGFPLADYLPYAVTRTWHTQLAIFWIATAWLATGLFIAPAVSGYEPKFQRLGVNVLFFSLVAIVVGTMVGTWFGTRQGMSFEANFWFGHQGYEYVDLGRAWQIFLLAGLFIWLALMVRALWPAFRNPAENKHLLALFLLSSAAIAFFYSAGLMWGRQTHLAVAEYWRWWVIHLWVEGFFEVFATVVMTFLFTRMGLVRVGVATTAVLFACSIFLAGGIVGTFHHLYFSGTPTSVMALGAVFSAMEIVPLTLIGFEAYSNLRLSRAPAPWIRAYRWPIYFFVAVAFWNLVGAGIFGFLINPPVALYYMQSLNTTPVHAHAALFGVYGMLGLGLTLFCLKGLSANRPWRTGALRLSFWSFNIGLSLMVLLSLLPIGLRQTLASVDNGLWYARSAEFMQTPTMHLLRWMRLPGDAIFIVGLLAFIWFVIGLRTGWSYEPLSTRPQYETPLPQRARPALAGVAREAEAVTDATRN